MDTFLINFNLSDSYAIFAPVLIIMTVIFVYLVCFSKTLGIYTVIFMVFFANTFEGYNMAPWFITWIAEFAIGILFLKVFLKRLGGKNFRFYLIVPLSVFLVLSLISAIYNRTDPLAAVLYLRSLLRYFLFFLVLLNLDLSEEEIRKINKFLFYLVILQLPVAFAKGLKYGISEKSVGTLVGLSGGGPSTTIPLIVIGFCIGFYHYYNPSRLYLFLALGFIAFSIVGAKRGFIFYLPVLLLYLLLAVIKFTNSATTLKLIALSAVLLLTTGYFAPKFLPTLNPEKVGAWMPDEKQKKGVSAVLQYAMLYNTRQEGEVSGGRISTTFNVYNILRRDGFFGLFFGKGPGSHARSRYIDSTEDPRIPTSYGLTDLAYLGFQVGIPGVLLFFLIPFKLLLNTRRIFLDLPNGYWKAFAFGTHAYCFIMIMIASTYDMVFLGDTISCIFFYSTAVLIHLNTEYLGAGKEV